MLERIPINLTIRSTKIIYEDLVSKFYRIGPFCPKKLCSNYFSLIIATIMDNKDPMPIIQSHLPEIEEQIYVSLIVTDDLNQCSKKEFIFIYTPDMTEDAFLQECTKVKLEITRSMTQTKKMLSGALKNIFGFIQTTPEHANLQFVLGNYVAARFEYGAIHKQFPELSRRMSEICRIILNEKLMLEPLAFDVLIQAERYDELYELSSILPFDARLAVRYYLLNKTDQRIRRMVLLSECIDGFKQTGDIKRLGKCTIEILQLLDYFIITEPFNEPFWKEYQDVILGDSEV